MIRKKPPAENTQRGLKLNNIFWNDIKRNRCIFCSQIHDAAGRTLNDVGKLDPNAPVCEWAQKPRSADQSRPRRGRQIDQHGNTIR